MKYFKTLTVIALVCITVNVNAQDNGTIKVYDNNDSTQRALSKQHTKPTSFETLVKFNPFMGLMGNEPLYIEHQLNEHFSVEAAPGVTFRDFELDVAPPGGIGNKTIDYFFPAYPDPKGYEAGLGYSIKLDVKYFFGNNMMDGWYISPQIACRHYVLNYLDTSELGLPTGAFSGGHTNVTDFMFVLGYESDDAWGMSVSRNASGLTVEYYMGFGYRLISGSGYTIITNSSTGVTIQTPVQLSFWRPAPYLGLNVGYAFQ